MKTAYYYYLLLYTVIQHDTDSLEQVFITKDRKPTDKL